MTAAACIIEYHPRGQRPRPRALRRALHLAWALACCGALLAAIVMGVATAAFHLVPLAVTSGSMEPAMPAHSLIFVEEVRPDDVRVGDIITFDPPGPSGRVTHRVVARELVGTRWYFQTKGDANPARDDWRRGLAHPERSRRGVSYGGGPAIRHVATIPYVGWVIVLGGFPRLRTALFFLPFALVGSALLTAIWKRPATT